MLYEVITHCKNYKRGVELVQFIKNIVWGVTISKIHQRKYRVCLRGKGDVCKNDGFGKQLDKEKYRNNNRPLSYECY